MTKERYEEKIKKFVKTAKENLVWSSFQYLFFRLYEAFQIKFLARISFFVVRLSFVARAERIIELN